MRLSAAYGILQRNELTLFYVNLWVLYVNKNRYFLEMRSTNIYFNTCFKIWYFFAWFKSNCEILSAPFIYWPCFRTNWNLCTILYDKVYCIIWSISHYHSLHNLWRTIFTICKINSLWLNRTIFLNDFSNAYNCFNCFIY